MAVNDLAKLVARDSEAAMSIDAKLEILGRVTNALTMLRSSEPIPASLRVMYSELYESNKTGQSLIETLDLSKLCQLASMNQSN